MINPARLHSDLSRLGRETEMFLATTASLSDDELAAPSQCEGWRRADVVAPPPAAGELKSDDPKDDGGAECPV